MKSSQLLLALIILTFAQYIVPYDYIAISLATPKIRDSLLFSPALLPWILGGYVLTFGGFLILGGRLGDLYGRKRMLLIGLTIFAACSVLTAFARTPETFLAFRFLKGIGSALLSPNALAAMTVLFPEGRERNKSFGLSSVFGGAFAIGFFLLAGNILAHGWKYLLLANVPLALAIGLAVWKWVPESKSQRPTTRFDFAGALLSILSFGTLSFTVANSFRIGLTSPVTLGLSGLVVVFFAALTFVEKRHPFPLVPLRLLKVRHLVGVYFVTFLWSASNTHYPLNLFLQDILKYTPQIASLAQLPTIFTGAIVSLLAVRLLNRYGAVRVLFGALVTEMLGIAIYASMTEQSGYWTHLFPAAVVASSSFLVIWMAVRLLGASGIPNEDQGVASGAIYAMQQLGNSFGIPTLAAVLNAATLSQGPKTLAHTVYGFHWMFVTSIILVFIAFIGGALIIRRPAQAPQLITEPLLVTSEVSPEPVA
jgi:MFS family permease